MKETQSEMSVTWKLPSLGRIIPVLIQWLPFIITVPILVMIALGINIYLKDYIYEIKARVYVKLGRELQVPSSSISSVDTIITKRPEDINNELEIMRNPQLIGQVVDFFGEDFFYRQPEPVTLLQKIRRALSDLLGTVRSAMEEAFIVLRFQPRYSPLDKIKLLFEKNLSMEVIRQSDVILLTLQSANRERGIEILQKYLDFYMITHIESHNTSDEKQYVRAKKDTLASELQVKETELAQFQQQNNVYDTDSQKDSLIKWKYELESRIAGTEIRIKSTQAEIDDLQRQLKAIPVELKNSRTERRNPLIESLKQQLIDLKSNLASLRQKYNEDNRLIQETKIKIEYIESLIKTENTYVMDSVTTGQNQMRVGVESALKSKLNELQGLKAQVAENREQITKVSDEILKFSELDLTYREIKRDIELLEQDYRIYTKKLENALITEAFNEAKIVNVAVITPPTASLKPTGLSNTILLVAGCVMGIFAAIVIAFLIDAFNPVIRMHEDVNAVVRTSLVIRIPNMKKKVKKNIEFLFRYDSGRIKKTVS